MPPPLHRRETEELARVAQLVDLQSVALCLHLEPLLSLADGGRITMSCSKKQAKGIFALKFSEF